MTAPAKRDLVGLTRRELAAEMASVGEKPFRAKQLWHWLYCRGARRFDDMANLPKALRREFAERYRIGRPDIAALRTSRDGSRKWLLRLDDGNEVECVHIPEADRGALCLSSQVGCTLTCRFCHTGTQRLVRNLETAEIVGQMLTARDTIGEWAVPPGGRLISNIVVMGMGEPLLNYDNVVAALGIVIDPEGLALSRRRITLSTSGVVPMIERLGRELDVGLAISSTRCATNCATSWCPSTAAIPSPCCSTPAPLPERPQFGAHHLRIRHAARRQRQRLRARELTRASVGHRRQGQPHSVQPLAGAPYRVLGREAHARLRGDRQRRRVLGACPRPARARHQGRLRQLRSASERAPRRRASATAVRVPA